MNSFPSLKVVYSSYHQFELAHAKSRSYTVACKPCITDPFPSFATTNEFLQLLAGKSNNSPCLIHFPESRIEHRKRQIHHRFVKILKEGRFSFILIVQTQHLLFNIYVKCQHGKNRKCPKNKVNLGYHQFRRAIIHKKTRTKATELAKTIAFSPFHADVHTYHPP